MARYSTLNIIQWSSFVLAVVVFFLLIVTAVTTDGKRIAFVEACETMGGVAIIGLFDTQACIKSEVLK
jgi:hypothetical protein